MHKTHIQIEPAVKNNPAQTKQNQLMNEIISYLYNSAIIK